MDNSVPKDLGEYMPSLTIYNIRQKSGPENDSPQFTPTRPNIQAPVKTATYNTNNNFGIRETQGQEPWCSSYVEAAAINAFRKATDVPITSAQTLMRLNRPGLSDDELKSVSGTTIADNAKKIKDNYNIGVTIEERALSFNEVKNEIDAGKLVQMDAYNINASNPEEGYGHALAIVGYVTSNDGDANKTPYYEIWNPWWNRTFYIPANNSTFRLAGIDYKWTRSWYNWRQDGVGSVDSNVANQAVSSMVNPNSLTNTNDIPENPLLSGKTFYSNNYSTKSKDVMTQNVSQFGRETKIKSKTTGHTYGYAFNKVDEELMLAKRDGDKKTTKNIHNAKDFSDSVDNIISAEATIKKYGLGTMLFTSLLVALQFIPVADWLGDSALWLITAITGAGTLKDAYNLATDIRDYYNSSLSAEESYEAI